MASIEPQANYQLYIGVDIAAATFTAAKLRPEAKPEKAGNYQQNQAGFHKLAQELEQTGVAPAQILVVLEATGTYWLGLAIFLHEAGFVVSVINPQQAHNYAKSLLLKSKNDQLDAQVLARFGQSHKPPSWTPPPALYHELQQRLNQREALSELRQQVRNQWHALRQSPVVVEAVQTRMEELLTTLEQQIRAVEKEIEEVAKGEGAWGDSISLLKTIPGIGLLTACWLVSLTLNFTSCEQAEQLVMYAGLAPIERSSGSSVRGHPHIGGGGNRQLRKLLYMATLSASRHNPMIRAFYERLRERGKVKKVAGCAAARKLVHLAFAVVKKGQAFEVDYGSKRDKTVA